MAAASGVGVGLAERRVLRCIMLVFLVIGGLALGGSSSASAAGPCGPPILNAVACENTQTGNPPSQWQIAGAGDPSIQGFATDISVNKGSTVSFKIKTDSTNYVLHIYRMGYYAGAGARLVATVSPSATLPQSQPACLTDPNTGLTDCGNWVVSASWTVPAAAVSGIYFAKLDRLDTPGSSHVFFVVRDDGGSSALLFQTADTTWQAYNMYGGDNLYGGSGPAPDGRAYKVSYNRPFDTASSKPESWVFNAEYPMVRWLEANGYDVSYFTGIDSDRFGTLIKNHRIFLSVGHDEYWSGGQRANVEAARAAGVSLAFFSGNEVFWKTRWEASIDGSGATYRTLVSYKETHANARIDPADPPTWTGTWRDPRFSPPADGGRPENALTGTLFMVNGTNFQALSVTQADGRMRFWRNTSAASLGAGQTSTYTAGCNCLIGYEWDEELDNGSRPGGLIRLSTTTANVPELLQDYGSTFAPGTATHSLTLYRAASGAIVFGAGTVGWAYGLDGNSDSQPSTPDVNVQQATVNLFADMRAQPATLQSGLVAATASTDTTAPSSAITSPTGGSQVPVGTTVTVTGTAIDSGGGVVGGVEVSADGGATWHAATGRDSWSYSWRASLAGQVTIKSRATDDSGNIETPSAGVTVTVGGQTCPCSLFGTAATPGSISTDSSALELGVKFRSDVAGTVTGARFYKGTGNTGTHVANLWSSSGAVLATATFSNETSSGWQSVSFATPVQIQANTVYVISYHTNTGNYGQDAGYFNSGWDNSPLHAPSTSTSGGNGVYAYGSSSTFPNNTFNASNYWVDVVFGP